jgi:hypothetical protein
MLFSWAHAFAGTAVLLANLTQGEQYIKDAETILLNWNQGIKGITYTPKGLAFGENFGSLRYSASAAFLALAYAKGVKNSNKQQYYQCFAKRQIRYMLGDTGRSYVVGVGGPLLLACCRAPCAVRRAPGASGQRCSTHRLARPVLRCARGARWGPPGGPAPGLHKQQAGMRRGGVLGPCWAAWLPAEHG